MFLLLLLLAPALHAQSRLHNPDSLYQLLIQHTQKDTNRVKTSGDKDSATQSFTNLGLSCQDIGQHGLGSAASWPSTTATV